MKTFRCQRCDLIAKPYKTIQGMKVCRECFMELKTEAGYIYCARCGRLIKRRPRENVKYLRLCPQCRRKTFEELRIKLAEVLA